MAGTVGSETSRLPPIRTGIAGLGKMGRIRAAELEAHPETVVVCGADPDPRTHAAFPGVPCHRDYREVLAAAVDAVFVATPNAVTPDVVVAALESGRHVFCEKPPGRNVADIRRIREVHARHPGLVLKFGFNHRYHAGVQEAKRIVDSGRLGRVMWMRGIYGKSGGEGFEAQWRSRRAEAGGGILLDQGIHMLDLFRHFAGDFTGIRAMVGNSFWPVDVEDNAFALLRTPGGVVAMLHSSSTQWRHRFSLEVYLTGGYVSINGILSSTRTYGDETVTVARRDFTRDEGRPVEETIYFDDDPSWELEVRDFVAHVRGGAAVKHGTPEDAQRAMELVEGIYAAGAA